MKKICLILAGLSFLFAISCFVKVNADPMASAPMPKAPQTQEDKKYTWDFGKAKQGEVLAHTFAFKNESSKILNIKNVTTTCGCTTSAVKKNSLKPGESTNIEVKFNSKGYAGAVKKFIYVNTDNLDNPVIRLIIKAEIVK